MEVKVCCKCGTHCETTASACPTCGFKGFVPYKGKVAEPEPTCDKCGNPLILMPMNNDTDQDRWGLSCFLCGPVPDCFSAEYLPAEELERAREIYWNVFRQMAEASEKAQSCCYCYTNPPAGKSRLMLEQTSKATAAATIAFTKKRATVDVPICWECQQLKKKSKLHAPTEEHPLIQKIRRDGWAITDW
jgi:hypothetical protein